MKNAILIILLFLNVNAYCQSFKITSVKTSNNSKFQEMNQKLLNKVIKASFNNDIVTITLAGHPKAITMIENKNNIGNYLFSSNNGSVIESYSIKFNKTLGVVTSLNFHYYKEYKTSGLIPRLDEHNEINAKRF